MSIVRVLESLGHQVSIVSPPGVDPRRTAGDIPLDKGAMRSRGITRLWQWISCKSPQWMFEMAELAYNLFALPRLISILRKNHVKSLVFYERHAVFLWAGVWVARWFGLPVVLEVNEVAGIQRARKQALVGLARWVERRVFSRADLILTVSTFLRNELLKRGARPETVRVLPNAIDPMRFSGANGRAVREELGLTDRSVIGFVGWFDRWDRLDLFVELAARLVGTHPDLRILLVGDGPVRAGIEQDIRRKGLKDYFLFTGPVQRRDVPHYIDAMDVCVLPDSNVFGSPMVLFEFMALAKAVVAPDLPPIRDVLSHLRTGLIARCGCLDSLEQAVRSLLDNPDLRQRLGREAQRAVMQEHTWEASGRKIVDFLRTAKYCDLAEIHT